MPISHKYKCIFVHIPKAAGESIEYALDIANDSTDRNIENRKIMYGLIDPSSIDLKNHGFLSPVLQHLTIKDLKIILPTDIFNQYFKFAFVRNPWDRILSFYLFTKKTIIQYSKHSFIQFLNELNPFLNQEQHVYIVDKNGETMVDFIGRFENLDKDFKIVCEKSNNLQLKLLIRNTTKHKHYSYYYTDETRQLVADLFKTDIEMFGYKFEKSNIVKSIKLGIKNLI